MAGRNLAQQRAMILSLLGDEMMETGTMYLAYPKGYDQGVADTNNRLYDNFVRLQFRGEVSPEVGRILIDCRFAKTLSRAYYCARAELVCRRGSPVKVAELVCRRGNPVDVKDAYVSIRAVLRRWHWEFGRMDLALAGNEDLAEIMQSIQLDGNEERDFRRWA